MKFKTIVYAAFIAAAAGAFAIGASSPSEAKAKKAVAPPPNPGPCFEISAPVCGVKGGMKFNYANACFAAKDGAKVVSHGACPTAKAHKHKKAKAAKSEKKPAKKMEKKADAKKPAAKKDDKKKM